MEGLKNYQRIQILKAAALIRRDSTVVIECALAAEGNESAKLACLRRFYEWKRVGWV